MKIIQIEISSEGDIYGLSDDGQLYHWNWGEALHATDPNGLYKRVGRKNASWVLERGGTYYDDPEFKDGIPKGWVLK